MIIFALFAFCLLAILPFLIIYGICRSCSASNAKSLIIATTVILATPFILSFISWLTSPTIPTKSDITGTYQIDTSQYPGKNADWQHQTYTVEITETHLTIHDTRTPTTFTYPIEWGYQYRWDFKPENNEKITIPPKQRHHLVRSQPTITRHPFSHTYTFQSPLYGTVFLKKK